MPKIAIVLLFVVMTVLCWGNYGPLMHHGQDGMSGSSLRPFIAVGLAYFLIAVIVPIVSLKTKGERGGWTFSGTVWSLLAGAAGAVGALGIIMAFKNRGNPVYVMPLVFGCAPVVNTFVTMWMTKTFKDARLIFFVGVAMVALGGAGVLVFKPVAQKAENVKVETLDNGRIKIIHVDETDPDRTTTVTKTLDELRSNPDLRKEYAAYRKAAPLTAAEVFLIPLSVALTALCWGSYGPVLHKGQMKMSGSRLRPFLCVGLSYFAIAVVVPSIALGVWGEYGDWSLGGAFWSLAAGSAGAVGALGIIMAFNFGGRPIFVMPLVFGGAPVINTFTSIIEQGTLNQLNAAFGGSLAMVIGGAATVLIFSPKPHKLPDAEKSDKNADKSERVEADHSESEEATTEAKP